jgi:hypothetical protein
MQSHAFMGAIQNLLERLGYVKLDRYGLLLTPEGRILSSRPAVLDDGLGGRIVGWQTGDLAAMELERWAPAQRAASAGKPGRPAPKQATASAVAVAMAPTIPAPARPPVPLAAQPVAPAVAVPVVFALTPAPVVEAAAEVPHDEDEWEWTIAVARARAAADEAERAAATPKFKPVVRTMVTTPPPLPVVEEDTQVKAVVPPPMPKTIIPVPQLPRAANPALVRPPVLARGSGPQVSPPLRRVPRGTDRVEDTVRTMAAPANDDKTSPGVALPPSGGGRRVAAKQR